MSARAVVDMMRRMMAAGAPPEAILIAAEAIAEVEAEASARRDAVAERKRRQRARERDSHGTVTGQSGDTPHPPQKVSPVPPSKTSPHSAPKGASLPPGESGEGAREIDLRRKICTAFEAAGKLPPSMHLVAVWLARGYSPELIEDVVCTGIRDGVSSLAYFEKVLPKEHEKASAQPRPPPERSGPAAGPASVTDMKTRKRHDPSVIEIGRYLADNPPPGFS